MHLDMEGLSGVNSVTLARAVSILQTIHCVVNVSVLVAKSIVTCICVFVASMRSGLEGVPVGLHDVKLGAVLAAPPASNGVAVVEAILGMAALSGRGWDGHGVEGVDSATVGLAHVDVELDLGAHQVHLKEVGVFDVVVWRVVDVAAAALRASVVGTLSSALVREDILGVLLAVDGDLDWVKVLSIHPVGLEALILASALPWSTDSRALLLA